MKIYEINCTEHGMIVWIKCFIKMYVLQSITFLEANFNNYDDKINKQLHHAILWN